MAGYMDGYGVDDARRERLRRRIFIALGALILITGVLYFLFRDYREEKQIQTFLDHLGNKRYNEAYALWGCTEKNPCRDYSLEKFLEDWGPQSPRPDAAAAKKTEKRSCSSGVIQGLDFGKGEQVFLWVNRNDLILGFAPWGPVCNPRFQNPTGPNL